MREYHSIIYLIRYGKNQQTQYEKTFNSYEEADKYREYMIGQRKCKNFQMLRKQCKPFKDVKTRFAAKLISEKRPLSFHSFIYALINKDEVVYIGQSDSLQSRIKSHIRDKEKEFDSWAIAHKFPHNTTREEREKREARYIKIFKPKYNITHNQ